VVCLAVLCVLPCFGRLVKESFENPRNLGIGMVSSIRNVLRHRTRIPRNGSKKEGVRTMKTKGREYKGYFLVSETE
jgi:hypothetical protein